MPDIAINLQLFLFIAVILAAFIIGLLFRIRQVSQLKSKVKELEIEILKSHAEILEQLEANTTLRQKDSGHDIPVIPLKAKENLPNKNISGN